jgi:hypothetical protein
VIWWPDECVACLTAGRRGAQEVEREHTAVLEDVSKIRDFDLRGMVEVMHRFSDNVRTALLAFVRCAGWLMTSRGTDLGLRLGQSLGPHTRRPQLRKWPALQVSANSLHISLSAIIDLLLKKIVDGRPTNRVSV